MDDYFLPFLLELNAFEPQIENICVICLAFFLNLFSQFVSVADVYFIW